LAERPSLSGSEPHVVGEPSRSARSRRPCASASAI